MKGGRLVPGGVLWVAPKVPPPIADGIHLCNLLTAGAEIGGVCRGGETDLLRAMLAPTPDAAVFVAEGDLTPLAPTFPAERNTPCARCLILDLGGNRRCAGLRAITKHSEGVEPKGAGWFAPAYRGQKEGAVEAEGAYERPHVGELCEPPRAAAVGVDGRGLRTTIVLAGFVAPQPGLANPILEGQ